MLSKALEDAHKKAKQRAKEQQSFEAAGEYSVQVKLNGIQQFVPIETVRVNGKPLADYLKTATETAAKVQELEKTVDGLTQSSHEQANLLKAVVATLKGEKL